MTLIKPEHATHLTALIAPEHDGTGDMLTSHLTWDSVPLLCTSCVGCMQDLSQASQTQHLKMSIASVNLKPRSLANSQM